MTNEQVIQALAHLIGTVYAPAVKDEVTKITERVRVLGPGDISTKEYDVNRIHIKADADQKITGFSFG